MSADDDGHGVFSVMMLDVLRPQFEEWLAAQGLVMVSVPGVLDPNAYAVVPAPGRGPRP